MDSTRNETLTVDGLNTLATAQWVMVPHSGVNGTGESGSLEDGAPGTGAASALTAISPSAAPRGRKATPSASIQVNPLPCSQTMIGWRSTSSTETRLGRPKRSLAPASSG